MSSAEAKPETDSLDLCVTRILPAPRAVVWRAWTDPRQIERWWHPKGFRRPTCERLELRVGGGFRIAMPAEDGTLYTAWGTYREIVPERKLAYDDRCDKDGRTFHAARLVVTFEESGERATKVAIRTSIDLAACAGADWTPAAIDEGWTKGWSDNLDGLAALLSATPARTRPSDHPFTATRADETPPMQQSRRKAENPTDRQIVTVRLIAAPRPLVWQVWTDSKHITHWWGPRGFSTTTQSMDLRPGGIWRFVMHGPDGTDYGNRITFLEVEEPRRLVYRHEGTDAATQQVVFISTVTFVEKEGKTEVTLAAEFPSAAERDHVAEKYGAVEGGRQTLERLAEHVASLLGGERRELAVTTPSEREIVLRRSFGAPAAVVWDVITKPEHVRQWYGCGTMTMALCEIDLQVGGRWRYLLRMPDGSEHGFHGVYQEIEPPRRLVSTEVYEPFPDAEAVVTVTLDERDGRTDLTSTIRHATKEARDGHLNSGMEQGAGESYRRLDREAMAEAEKRHAYSLTVSRDIAAPRQLVWDAWTKPEHTDKWGPVGFTVAQKNDAEVKPGGRWRAVLKPTGQGRELWQGGVYREVKEPERLVFTFAWDDEEKRPGHEMLITLTFEELAKDRTRLTLRQDFLPSLAERDGHAGGWGEALDALTAHLETVARGR